MAAVHCQTDFPKSRITTEDLASLGQGRTPSPAIRYLILCFLTAGMEQSMATKATNIAIEHFTPLDAMLMKKKAQNAEYKKYLATLGELHPDLPLVDTLEVFCWNHKRLNLTADDRG